MAYFASPWSLTTVSLETIIDRDQATLAKRENDLTLGGVLVFHPAVFRRSSHDKEAEVKNTSASGEDLASPWLTADSVFFERFGESPRANHRFAPTISLTTVACCE